jgi:hypothetical protein
MMDMVTQQTQIKLTLPVQLYDFLESKARRLGLPVAAYLRHLAVEDVKGSEYPVFEMSERTEKAYNKAVEDYKNGKTIAVDDIDKFFDNL